MTVWGLLKVSLTVQNLGLRLGSFCKLSFWTVEGSYPGSCAIFVFRIVLDFLGVLGSLEVSPRARYSLIKEYSLNHLESYEALYDVW